jgi:hypothetical protein
MINLEQDSVKKVIKVTVSGMVKVEEANEYLKNLEDVIKKVDSSKYALVIDAREQKAAASDALPHLERAMKLYAETPFAKRFAVVLESVVAMQQVKRVGKGEVEQFTFVSSVEEAYKMI